METLEVRNATRLRPVGRCIYCGSDEDLTEEHIIPFALGGNLIIPDASCKTCARITSAFEGKVLRGFMHDARLAGGFPTRHPKKRPKTVPILAKGADEADFRKEELPAADALGMVFLPKLKRAAFLAGEPPVSGVTLEGLQGIAFGKLPEEVARALNAKTLQISKQVEAQDFVRMLAKIGYSYAVSGLGFYPLAEVPVLPLILGQADDGSTWVGSADYRIAIEEKGPQHALELITVPGIYGGVSTEATIARVKLFASSGATGYEVVVRLRRM